MGNPIRSAGQVPIFGQKPSQEDQKRIQIEQAMSGVALGIYTQLAVAHIASIDVHEAICTETLEKAAVNANKAATAYFVGSGIIRTSE